MQYRDVSCRTEQVEPSHNVLELVSGTSGREPKSLEVSRISADNGDSSVGMQGRVPSSGSLPTKTLPEKLLEKATSGYTPTLVW